MADACVCVVHRVNLTRVSQKSVDEFNQQFRDHLYICRTGSESHMWSAETCVQFFKFLREVICFIKPILVCPNLD